MPSGPVRIGLIGAGGVATRHARTLSGFGDVALVAVADIDAARGAALAAECGAASHTRWEEMLDSHDLDALYVCVPPFAHGPPEHAALERGLSFFVEKPIAIALEIAESVAEAVEATGLLTAVGYHWRYLDTAERALALLAERPARLVMGYWLDKVPPVDWWLQRERSGGQVIEQTTHVLDLIRYLVGEVIEVCALESVGERVDWPEADIADVSAAVLRFANGAVGSVCSSSLLASKYRTGVELISDGATIELTEESMTVGRGERREAIASVADAKTQADRDFVDAVAGKENRIRAPYAEALRTHRLACALSRSATDGLPVTLGQSASV